jgi:hypothetical protein
MRSRPDAWVRRSPAAVSACLLALLLQLAPLFFLGRPIGVSDILETYSPWREPGARPPSNPLLDDAATGMHPWLAALRRDHLFLATPNLACGAIGPAAGVFGLLSPSVALPFLLPRALAFSGMAVFDLLFGFAAFYLWRRRRGDADLPAALGAAVWAWAPARVVYRTWPFCGITVLFPLLLLAVDRRHAPGSARTDRTALFWAALTFGVVLGGHPSFGLMGIYLAFAYGLMQLFARRRSRHAKEGQLVRDSVPPRAHGLAGAGLIGVTLAVAALSPVIALGRSFLQQGEWARLRAGLSSAPPIPWRILFLLFDPAFYGDPVEGNWRGLGWAGPDNLVELQLYMGLLTLLLVPLAIASRRRNETLFFGVVAGASLAALLLGGHFAFPFRILPGFDIIYLSRLRLLVLFSAAVLTTLGATVFLRLSLARWRGLAPALLLFMTVDLSLNDLRFDPFPEKADAVPVQTPAVERLIALAPGGGHRFLGFGTTLVPNLAFEFGLEDLRSHLLFTAGYRRLLSRLDPQVYGRRGTFLTFEPETFRPDPELLDLLGVAALIAPPHSDPPGGDFVLDRAGKDADVYRRPWRAPARLVSRRGGAQLTAAPLADAHVVSFKAHLNDWTITTEAPIDSTLLVGRSHLVIVDRIRVDALIVDAREDPRAEGLIAVDLPPGRHEVSIGAALPRSLLILSVAGGAGLLLLIASSMRRQSERPAVTGW